MDPVRMNKAPVKRRIYSEMGLLQCVLEVETGPVRRQPRDGR